MMNQLEDSLHWIASAGGPLILLSGEHLSDWSGIGLDDQLDFDILPTAQETDYDRACAVEGYLELLRVGAGQGLILGDEPMSTAWWQLSATEGILIRWVYGDDEANPVQLLMPIEAHIWTSSGLVFIVGQHPPFLFDSAEPGEEASERLTIALDEGKYAIDTEIARPNDRTEMVLHRFCRQ